MGLSKVLSALLYFGTAFCIGSCEIFGMNPLGICFVVACGIIDDGVWIALFGVVLGNIGVLAPEKTIYYSVLMLGCIGLLQLKQIQFMKRTPLVVSALTGIGMTILNVLSRYLLPVELHNAYGLFEGLLVFSFSYIFYCGLNTLREDYMSVLRDNQSLIGVLVLATAVVYGAPLHLFRQVAFAETLCLFSMLAVLYKFGLAFGVSWGAVCGTVVAYRMGTEEKLSAWVFLLLLSYALCSLFHMGRYGFAATVSAVYLLLGKFAAPALLTEAALKAGASSLFLFLLIPGRLLLQVDGQGVERLGENQQEWGTLVVNRMRKLAAALKRIDYTFAVAGNSGIGFRQVGTMLEQFTDQLEEQVPMKKTAECGIVDGLGHLGIQVKSISLLKSPGGQYTVYLSARVRRGNLVGADTVRKIVSRELNMPMELTEESRQLVGRHFDLICLRQKPEYRLCTAARNLSRHEDMVSGDSYYIGDILRGKKLVMVADGMGNGARAAADSSVLLESLEELLSAGFDQELSVQVVNAYLSEKNRGEHFTTLDMLLMDTYTGYGRILKHGAATTYIKRGKWLECLKSTSLPIGVKEDADVEACGKKFYHGDLIVLVSDGVLESIMFENKDDYMQEILSGMEEDEPEYVVETIVEEIRKVCGKRLRDDATVVACKLVKTL